MISKFICIQPIKIQKNKLIEMFSIKEKFNFIENKIISKNKPSWINEFNNTNEILYEHLHSLKINKIDNNLFINDLPIEIQKDISSNNIKYYLLFDEKLNYFILFFEFNFKFNDFTKLENINIYSIIRNLLVKENDNSIISKWTTKIYNESFKIIKNIYNKLLFDENSIIIKNNTGNISNILHLYNTENSIIVKNLFIDKNIEADRIENYDILKLSNNEEILFNSRFHTIIINNKKNINRYTPILFQMQYNWFYIFILTEIHNEINFKILSDNFNLKYEEKKLLLNVLINKILLFEATNEIFKFSIENDKNEIYDNIEKKWNLENTIKVLITYIKKYENHLYFEYKKQIDIEKAKSLDKTNKLINEIKILNEERRLLEDNIYKDHLTRSKNRKKFEIDSNDFLSKFDNDFYLVFIDGDKFKNINDTYGHQAGDEVLKEIVNTIYKILYDNSIDGDIYRFGGEEFIITIYNEKKTSTIGILNMIKNEIENSIIEFNNEKINFTISIGVTKYQENDTIEQMISRSDNLVYKAKENGRNRIENDF
jgi:diguanylate cyclase (GGDEF)-like protein